MRLRQIPFQLVVLCLITTCFLTACETQSVSRTTQTVVKHLFLSDSGCGRLPGLLAGTSANESIDIDGSLRIYRLHVPLDYRPRVKQPLILNFHGHGSSATVQERYTRMSQLADHSDFIVAYPQGTVGIDGRTGWNTGPYNYPHVDDVLFTSDLISHLEATLCVNPQRVYAVGFSNGGGFTNVLACKLSDRIAAVAIVSGGMHPVAAGCNPQRPVPILEFHGTNDHVVPYNGNRLNDDEPPIQQWLGNWVQRDDCRSRAETFYGGRGVRGALVMGQDWNMCKGNVAIVHYRITDGTHRWPLGDFASPPTPGSKFRSVSSHYSDATTLIWQFLQKYSQ